MINEKIELIDWRKSRQNMRESFCFILLIGEKGLHPKNLLEISWAIEYSKKIIVVHFENSPLEVTKRILGKYVPVEYIKVEEKHFDAEFNRKVLPLIEKYKLEAL